MTVGEAKDRLGLQPLVLPMPEREIKNGYCGDLLSWVMTRLSPDEAWVTIMSNINVVAVAALADPACVILADGADVDEAFLQKAEDQGVNVLRTNKSAFTVCSELGACMYG